MPLRYTERGFADYAEFVDSRGNTVTIRQSSCVALWRNGTDEDNGPFLWIFSKGPDGEAAIHLGREEARQVIAAVQEWMDDPGA